MKTFADPLVSTAVFIPLLRKMPYFGTKFYYAIDLFNEIFAFIDNVIDQHKKHNDYKTLNEPRDFIDAFLMEQARATETGEVHYFS